MAKAERSGPPIHTRFYRMRRVFAETVQGAVLWRFAAPGGKPL